MQETIAQIMGNHWTPVFIAFLLGLLIGWMVWGAPWRDDQHDDVGDGEDGEKIRREPLAEYPADPSKAGQKIGSIEAEIAKVKSLLETAKEGDDDLSAELDAVDNAVKRANGRLKLILKSVDRVKDSE